MGSVWRVHHKNWNVDLAMKRPQPRFFAEGSEKRTCDMHGRLIGGCADILTLLCGTKYDKVSEFAKKYEKDDKLPRCLSTSLNVIWLCIPRRKAGMLSLVNLPLW